MGSAPASLSLLYLQNTKLINKDQKHKNVDDLINILLESLDYLNLQNIHID